MAQDESQVKKVLEKVANSCLPDSSYFIVGIDYKPALGGLPARVRILADGDSGITIDVCSGISRAMGGILETHPQFNGPYVLEVSSPGLENGLQLHRQYVNNTGRLLKVQLVDGTEIKGKLTEVSADAIVVEYKPKDAKKKDPAVLQSIAFNQIKKTVVQISFKTDL